MTNYERGFITKCAEYGVDPAELIKQAGFLDAMLKGLGNLGSVGKMYGSSLWNILKGAGKGIGKSTASAFNLAKPELKTIGKSIGQAAAAHPLIAGSAAGLGAFTAGYGLANKLNSSKSNPSSQSPIYM
jgi:hypothetical protein